MTAPKTVALTFTDADGVAHTIDAPVGLSVMEALQAAGLIDGECGGALACATCHVWLDPAFASAFPEPDEEEEDILDVAFNITETSRLSCQLIVPADLDAITCSAPRTLVS